MHTLQHNKQTINLPLWSIFAMLALAILIPAKQASAVPAFARQMNAECSTCHFQHFPKLNAFGRSFKASGFSMTSREMLEGDKLAIAPNLNATFFMRSRYVDETGTTRDQWQVPDEAAILVGGRLAEGAGGLVEWGGPLLGAKISLTNNYAGIDAGMTLFATDALGAGYGFELMNTGAVRNMRPSERSSKPLIGNNSNLETAGAATGVAFHAATGNWFVAATLFAPDSGEAGLTEMDAGMHLSNYLRAAYMQSFGAMEMGIGMGIHSGKTTATTTTQDVDDLNNDIDIFSNTPGVYDIHTNAMFVDLQLQGTVAERKLGVYFMYAQGEENKADGTVRSWAGVSAGEVPVGMGLDIEFSLTPSVALLASYGNHNNGDAAKSESTTSGLGFYWHIAQNITVQPMYEMISGEQSAALSGKTEHHRGTIALEAAW